MFCVEEAVRPDGTETRVDSATPTAAPTGWPDASSEKSSVRTSSDAASDEAFAEMTCMLTTADSAVTRGVVTIVPQCATWIGAVRVSQTLR